MSGRGAVGGGRLLGATVSFEGRLFWKAGLKGVLIAVVRYLGLMARVKSASLGWSK